jgi:hypothetical protein
MLLKLLRILAYIFLLAAIFICIWQRDNITALIYAATMDRSDLAQSDVKTEAELKESLNTKGLTMPEISQDDINEIIEAGKTAREAAEELLNNQIKTSQEADKTEDKDNGAENTAEQDEINTNETNTVKDDGGDIELSKSNPSSEPSETPKEAVNEEAENKVNSDNEIDKLNYELNLRITELYILQTSYSSQIEKIVNDAKEEYLALKEEEQTKTNRYRIILKKIDVMTDLEAECDEKVKTLVSEIKNLLTEAGMDTSLADEIMDYYENKKKEENAVYLKNM